MSFINQLVDFHKHESQTSKNGYKDDHVECGHFFYILVHNALFELSDSKLNLVKHQSVHAML